MVAPLSLDLAAALGLALDHAEHGEAWKGDLAGVAPAREQPGHVVADRVAAGLDPAVLAVGGLEALQRPRGRAGEERLDIPEGGRAVALERRQPRVRLRRPEAGVRRRRGVGWPRRWCPARRWRRS